MSDRSGGLPRGLGAADLHLELSSGGTWEGEVAGWQGLSEGRDEVDGTHGGVGA